MNILPDYKKRKRSRFLSPPKATKNTKPKKDKSQNIENDIPMTSDDKKSYKKTNNIKVIEGRKREKKRRFRISLVIVATLVAVIIILENILPAGIVVAIKTGFKTIGSGSFPISLSGSQTVTTASRDSYFYLLSNTHLTAYSNSGKELFNYEHGLEKPVLKISARGAIVYNQGNKEVLVFDINGLKHSFNAKKNIITANISNSGYFAIATISDKYASEVIIYNKDAKTVYEWYSAEDTVNAVALSKNGKKLAVSVFNSVNGEYVSKVNVLNYKSATPEFTETYDNTLVYNLDSSFSSYFAVVTSNKIKVIKWSNFKSNEYKSEYSLSVFNHYNNGYVAVFNRQNDKTDNKIVLLSKKGKIETEIDYVGEISDIDVRSSSIYCMNDTEILMVSEKGKILKKSNFGFGGVNLLSVSSSNVLVITDNKIEKIKLTKG